MNAPDRPSGGTSAGLAEAEFVMPPAHPALPGHFPGRPVVPGVGQLQMRIGLATGSVVAGVIGKRKFRWDLWGDTVNTASRMESHGEPGMIHVTSDIYRALPSRYEFRSRGEIPIKGKGLMETYFLLSAYRPASYGVAEGVTSVNGTSQGPALGSGETDSPSTAVSS